MIKVRCIRLTAGGAWTATVYVDGQSIGKATCGGQHQAIDVPAGVDSVAVARQVALWTHHRRLRRQCQRWTLYKIPGSDDVKTVYQEFNSYVRDQLVGQYGADVTILNEELA